MNSCFYGKSYLMKIIMQLLSVYQPLMFCVPLYVQTRKDDSRANWRELDLEE